MGEQQVGASRRVNRSRKDLLDSLRNQVGLLREYAARAFEANDSSFLGEVAGKLRLLACASGRNKPLLLKLMEAVDFQPKTPHAELVRYGVTSIADYMRSVVCKVDVPERGVIDLTNQGFVLLWAEQHGAAHEDWAHSPELVALRKLGRLVKIDGMPLGAAPLRDIATLVLAVAEEFLESQPVERQAVEVRRSRKEDGQGRPDAAEERHGAD